VPGAGVAAAGGSDTGLVEVETGLLPNVAVVPRRQDRGSGWADPQPARGAGGQRPHVVAGHPDDRRRVAIKPVARIAAVVCRPRRRCGQSRGADDGAHRQGHPDRACPTAPAPRGGGYRRRPTVCGPHGGGVPRGHHLVRPVGAHPPGLGAVLPGDVPGRRRHRPTGPAAAAALPAPRCCVRSAG
jgi:hypothetical protein